MLIDDPTQAELVRSCYFDLPTEAAVTRFHASYEWRSVRRVIGVGGGRALDVGAGNGIVSYALSADGWTTTALEPDPSDLVGRGAINRLNQSLCANVTVIGGSGEKVPLADESFDLVIARQVLHHANDLDAFCREIARVVAPGGKFLAYRDHVVSGPEQLPAFFERHALHRHYGGENALPEDRYRTAIEGAGFRILRRWRQFEAAFNYAPKVEADIARDIASHAVTRNLAAVTTWLIAHPMVFPIVGTLLSAIDRRPGRAVAFLARKPL